MSIHTPKIDLSYQPSKRLTDFLPIDLTGDLLDDVSLLLSTLGVEETSNAPITTASKLNLNTPFLHQSSPLQSSNAINQSNMIATGSPFINPFQDAGRARAPGELSNLLSQLTTTSVSNFPDVQSDGTPEPLSTSSTAPPVSDPISTLEVLGSGADSDYLMRKLGGFRNIGWTLEHRTNSLGQNEHQALVYSLHTFNSYVSSWCSSESCALQEALSKCYEAEKGEHDNNLANRAIQKELDTFIEASVLPDSNGTPQDCTDSSTNKVQQRAQKSVERNETHTIPPVEEESVACNLARSTKDAKPKNTRVLVWTSYMPESSSLEEIITLWRSILCPANRLLGVLRTPMPTQGILIFDDLLSAIDFIRTAKSKQLEIFDLLVAGERTNAIPSSSQHDVLFNSHTGEAVGFSLVNVSPQHPTCVHTLLRLSQKDAVALGHKRTSTETLRLLLTHPEVSPLMVVPPAQPYGSYVGGRTTPLSQTPSHRRASIWCALCCTQASDIPGAWKHLSRNPHEALRDARNASLMEWIASKDPALYNTLMDSGKLPESLTEARIKEITYQNDPKGGTFNRKENSVLNQMVDRFKLLEHSMEKPNTEFISRQWELQSQSSEKALISIRASNATKELNPEASPFVPGFASLPTISPTKKVYHSDVLQSICSDWKAELSEHSTTPEPSANEALLLREWTLKQGLSPRQSKQSVSKSLSASEPSGRLSTTSILSQHQVQSRDASTFFVIHHSAQEQLESPQKDKKGQGEGSEVNFQNTFSKSNDSAIFNRFIDERNNQILDSWSRGGGDSLFRDLGMCNESQPYLLSSPSSSCRESKESLFNPDHYSRSLSPHKLGCDHGTNSSYDPSNKQNHDTCHISQSNVDKVKNSKERGTTPRRHLPN